MDPSSHRSCDRLVAFLQGVRQELAKVTWPSRREVVVYTIVVLAVVILMGALVSALDYLFSRVTISLFGA